MTRRPATVCMGTAGGGTITFNPKEVVFMTLEECREYLPDGWTEFGAAGERISPAQRYMALGNSIALPCAFYIMEGIKNSVN